MVSTPCGMADVEVATIPLGAGEWMSCGEGALMRPRPPATMHYVNMVWLVVRISASISWSFKKVRPLRGA